ncbi:MAG: hypothetical protein MJ233_04980 [Mycoplasmoidaceae bacterium]|nr:hypothetical protein [Mycoplasmoidaceae bacterium]
MGLIDNGTNTDTIPSEYCFSYLFSADGISDGGQNAITSVSTTFLPAMNLTKNCYYRMFSNCDGLTGSTPNLPAKVLAPACYMSMFRDSGAISYINISANQFPTTGLAPFEYMFYGCPNMSYIGLA